MDDPGDSKTSGNLYIVATPIGNMEDITLRAIKTLKEADLIAAENTRWTAKLLSRYQIKSRLISFHEHNEKRRTALLMHKLKSGASVALVSNAGTPLVSDPGYRLVKEGAANNIRVVPVPGVSAAIAALSVSGFPTDSFVFEGFLPKARGKRIRKLKELAAENRTIIFYESARRILTLLEEIRVMMGDRTSILSREMTKIHEEFVRGRLSKIIAILRNRSELKGECTLVIKGAGKKTEISKETWRKEIKKRLSKQEGTLSDLAKILAKKYDLPKNEIYEEALKIKDDR